MRTLLCRGPLAIASLGLVLLAAAPARALFGFDDGGPGRIWATTLSEARSGPIPAPVPVRLELRGFDACPADEDPATLARPRQRDCRFEAQLADLIAASGRFAQVYRQPQPAGGVDVVVTPVRSRVAVERTYIPALKVVLWATLGVYALTPLPVQTDVESYDLALALTAPDGTSLGTVAERYDALHRVSSSSSDAVLPQGLADALGPARVEQLQPVICDGPHAPEAASAILDALAGAAAGVPRR